jgi:hypothetical protein
VAGRRRRRCGRCGRCRTVPPHRPPHGPLGGPGPTEPLRHATLDGDGSQPAGDRSAHVADHEPSHHDDGPHLDRWPSLPAGSADPRARDHRDRPTTTAADDRWPALPDEDRRWFDGAGALDDAPAAELTPGRARGLAGGSPRDHAADLDAEQRGR